MKWNENATQSAVQRALLCTWPKCRNVDRAEEAAQKFKEVQEAFEVLSDPARRQELDGFEERVCNVCLIFS